MNVGHKINRKKHAKKLGYTENKGTKLFSRLVLDFYIAYTV